MATTNSIIQNEVWSGAGASATFIPETSIYLGDNADLDGATLTPHTDFTNNYVLVPDLYQGCMIRITGSSKTMSFMVKSNTATAFTFDENAEVALEEDTSGATTVTATLEAYGSPCVSVDPTNGSYTLLSDNWLGLVNSFTPPSLEVEIAQMNLALGGTRNLTYQYKKGSTVTGVSMDISMNHGAWLYYALGRIDSIDTTDDVLPAVTDGYTGFAVPAHDSTRIYRVEGNKIFPPAPTTWSQGVMTGELEAYNDLEKLDTDEGSSAMLYTFTERNDGTLPSFAIEVSYEKEDIAAANRYTGGLDNTSPYADIFTRIVTGCQVNTFTMNFEEGQELKCSLDLMSRRLFDVPSGYAPRNGKTNELEKLSNFRDNATMYPDRNVEPYFYSDGTITLYGQTWAKIKNGSLTINNNLTAHRYIGNYSKDMVSAHIGGQRTYDLSFTMLVTDMKIYNYLRQEGEHLGADNKIILKFSKDLEFDSDADDTLQADENVGIADGDFIEIELRDFITQSVDFPFPEDKGPVELNLTLSARTLHSCKYKGMWAIINQDY